ncbi:hypothetical protein LWI28_007559 [Acer negundo]|uniref:Zinc finger PMZ-type domain-containing protein n=1 Tax=Acer negundo TaxID=4023 RepID=A0AAD5IPE3_ACENE|nr:hypothetical protein LWI28_007559 [Acer negundo]
MFAIRIDADNPYYPIAYIVVEKESYDTWKWLLKFLRIDLNLNQSFGITFMIDKQKGLVEAINELWRNSEHRFCVRYMYANFKKKFKGDLVRNKVWQAAKASTDEEWKDIMEKIKVIDVKAWQWLNDKPANQWTKSHFLIFPKCDMLLNNLCECVNGDKTILTARCLLIYSMLELIKVKITERRASRRQYMGKWFGEIGPRIAEILEIATKNSGSLTAHWGGNDNFQINDNDDTTPVVVVDLTTKTCNCNQWNLTGIPYMHAITAIYWRHENLLYWNKSELPPLLPPKIVKQASHPKKLRYRVVSEIPANARKFIRIHRSYTCTKCKQQGHSFKTCDKRVALLAKIHKQNLNQLVVNQQPDENQRTETFVDSDEDGARIMTLESIGQQINMDNIEQILANVRTLKQHYATNLIPHLHPNDPLLHYFQSENQVEEEQPQEQQAQKGKSKKKKAGGLRKK